MNQRVFICSPLRGHPDGYEAAQAYLRRCLSDSLDRGEAPFTPHAIYPLVLDGGQQAGLAWLDVCHYVAVYVDFGASEGMRGESLRAQQLGLRVELREIGKVAP